MSKTLTFATRITDHRILEIACDNMRKAGLKVEGPRHSNEWQRPRGRGTIEGYAVKLPGWQSQALFACDPAGTMLADNYSDYHDDREIDPTTGHRIDGTGSVHPLVASGQKQVGEDGRWGNIEYLKRLQSEYVAAALVQAAEAQGYSVTKAAMDGVQHGIELEVMVPG